MLTAPKDAELLADRHKVLLEKMQLMEDRLSDGRKWLLGEAFSLADIALAPRTEMFPIIEIADLYQRFPRIGALMERVRARPSWPKSAIQPEKGEATRKIAA